jgi:uncharacterized membrane protein YccC
MDWSIFALLLGLFLFLLILFQRIDHKKRTIVVLTLIPVYIFTWNYIQFREVQTEALLAFAIAALLSFLFWLLIGRYNRTKSADETIQVLGLDD